MTAHPGCRIRSVRPKDGSAKLIVFPDSSVRDRVEVLRRVREILDMDYAGDLAGFAFLAWDSGLASSGFMTATERGRIPTIAMPEFIKNRLMALKIQEWIKE